jgi:hypothetical protein
MRSSRIRPTRGQGPSVGWVLSLAVLGIAGLILLLNAQQRDLIVITSAGPEVSIEDLTASAEIIAIVTATGENKVHWNSEDNSKWESQDARVLAMIYNDQTVEAIRILKGEVPDRLTIRNIGGTVDGTEFRLDGLKEMREGSQYLVYLKTFDTPTREGVESALSFVAQGQGIFELTEHGFVNEVGLTIGLSDLR